MNFSAFFPAVQWRWLGFILFFALALLLERWRPLVRGPGLTSRFRSERWPVNMGLLLAGVALVSAAQVLNGRGLSGFGEGRFSVLHFMVLDFALFVQHWAFHRVPFFWRFHQVHHSDVEFDVTTGYRFHPIEILMSWIYKLAIVAGLQISAITVLVFEIFLNGASALSHANLRLPSGLDRWLRRLLVTPAVHRVHHSPDIQKTDSNFGFQTTLWDRAFGTYRSPKAAGDGPVEPVGLQTDREPQQQRFFALLTRPWRTP
jgi:sterol desaturase/sphingolipid hydroxylase (fatty acid hydroxylase superfamily)